MEVYAWLIVITLFKEGASLKCYTCTANSHKSCMATQQVVECAGTCSTLSYMELEDGEYRNNYMNACVNKSKKECERHCETLADEFVKNCKVHLCCSNDECNKATQVVVHRKRSSTDKSRSQRTYREDVIVFLVASSFLLSLFLGNNS